MYKNMKYSTLVLLAMLLSAFMVALSPNALAQDNEATVIILVSPEEGGTTEASIAAFLFIEKLK